MTKNTIIRFLLDLFIICMLGYAAWSFSQFEKIAETNAAHDSAIKVLSEAVSEMGTNFDRMATAMEAQNDKLERIVMLATFRTDPWSGRMMVKYHSDWINWVMSQDPDFRMSDGPDVYSIQHEFAPDTGSNEWEKPK
jgi:hypothetical protein